MEHSIYGWIEAYARGLCDPDSFTGEITALCCRGPAMEGVSEAEALLLEQLCAGAQRFFDGSDAYPGRDQLDEAQFHRFFVRLYPELKRQMPHAVCKEFSD